MQTIISLLRGINMTGHNSVKMKDLLQVYNNLGFINAESYIQSGNVIFGFPGEINEHALSTAIHESIKSAFGYDIAVIIRSVSELNDIKTANPFLSENNFDPSKMAVIFLTSEVTAIQKEKVATIDYPPDKFFIRGREIYIYCPNGFGKTKLYTNFFENRMGVTGTARNWKSITTILQIAEKKTL